MGNLLLVDDERDVLAYIAQLFTEKVGTDIDVFTANSAQEALSLLDAHRFDVVMTDVKMPGMNGVTLYHKIKANWPLCQVILLTGYRDFDTLYELADDHEVVYLLKSESDATIIQTVETAFDRGEHALAARQQKQSEQLATDILAKQHILMTQWQQGGIALAATLATVNSQLAADQPALLAVWHVVTPLAPGEQRQRLLQLHELAEVALSANYHYECFNITASDWVLLAQARQPVSSVVFIGALQVSKIN